MGIVYTPQEIVDFMCASVAEVLEKEFGKKPGRRRLHHRPLHRHRQLHRQPNSFVDQLAFDGMRKRISQDFTQLYHLDLHGNVRLNPKLSGTTHNVFGIQVGVGIITRDSKRGAKG